ncbi:unnamed protein product [Nesidiocoris tenuis]|nr:unnamed protein product [Nesidiocoris tenuis]
MEDNYHKIPGETENLNYSTRTWGSSPGSGLATLARTVVPLIVWDPRANAAAFGSWNSTNAINFLPGMKQSVTSPIRGDDFAEIDEFANETRYANVENCLNAIVSAEENNRQLIIIGDELATHKLNVSIFLLPWPKTVYSASQVKNVIGCMEGLVLLLPDTNATNYDLILEANSNRPNLKFVAFSESVKTVYHLLEQFWEFKMLDVIVLYYSPNQVISVFTYRPFSRHGCNTDTPIRINKWIDHLDRFDKRGNLFSKMKKIYDLHGCPIKASIQKTQIRASSVSLPQQIFHFFEAQLNFTGIVVQEEVALDDNYFTDYMNMSSSKSLALLQGNIDIAVGAFSMLLDQGPDLFAPLQTSMDCYTWAVPVKAGKKPSMWTTYFYEFQLYTWFVIGGLQLLATVFLNFLCRIHLNRRDPFSKSFNVISSFAFLLGLAVKTKPVRDSLRVFYIAMVLFCFVTNSAYQGAMGSLVTVPPDSYDVKDTEELLTTDLILSGYPRMFLMLQSSNRTSQTVHEVLERFQTINPGEFMKTLRKLYTTRRFAVFHRADEFQPYEDELRDAYNVSKPFHLVQNCLFTSFSGPFLMKAGSMFAEPFSHVGNALLESGFLERWKRIREMENLIVYRDVTGDIKFRKFSIEQLKGALIILICGHIISAAMFILEILSKGVIYNKKLVKEFSGKIIQTFMDKMTEKIENDPQCRGKCELIFLDDSPGSEHAGTWSHLPYPPI